MTVQLIRQSGYMRRPNIILAMCLVAAAVVTASDSVASFPSTADASLVATAKREGSLTIYSNFRVLAVPGDLITAFRQQYPFIKVTIVDYDGASNYRRYLSEVQTGKPSADLLWSAAMDMQEKLINDGYALPYKAQASE